jgi:hypothetical protein
LAYTTATPSAISTAASPALNAMSSGIATPTRPRLSATRNNSTASQHGMIPPPSPSSTTRAQPNPVLTSTGGPWW